MELISHFENFHICHVPRNKNRRADALASAAVEMLLEVGTESQVPEVTKLSDEVEQELTQQESQAQRLLVSTIMFSQGELYVEKVKEEDRYTVTKLELVDPLTEYRIMVDYLTHGRKPEHYSKEKVRSLKQRAEEFSVYNEELFKKGLDGVFRLCIYGERIPQLLMEAHDSVCGGHFDARVTARKLLRSRYRWPNLVKDVHAYCRVCDECQRFAPVRQKIGELFPIIPTGPFAKWGIDAIDPINPVTESGSKYILTATDYCTRWVEAEAVTAITAGAVAEFLYRYIVCRFGCPSELVSDQGKEFLNETVRNLNKVMSTKHQVTTSYHPRCNGLAESSNKAIIKVLSKLVFSRGTAWDYYLQAALWAFRTKVKVFLGCSPYNLVYRCEARLPSHVQRESVEHIYVNEMLPELETMEQRRLDLNVLDELRRDVLQKLDSTQATRKVAYDKKHVKHDLAIGDFVLRLNTRRYQKREAGSKLLPRWEGPYQVVEVFSNGTMVLCYPSTHEILPLSNSMYLKRYFF